jgi:hypothetical protein
MTKAASRLEAVLIFASFLALAAASIPTPSHANLFAYRCTDLRLVFPNAGRQRRDSSFQRTIPVHQAILIESTYNIKT